MNRWLVGLCSLSLWLGASAVRAQDTTLSVRTVVSAAKQHSPTLKAAMLQFESASWDVFGKDALYDPVLLADASASQVATPNVSSNAVRINKVRRVDYGATLSKHLLWGTDLSLRVSSYVQKSEFSGSSSATTPGGMTGLPANFASFFGIGSYGPVYALVAKATLKQPLGAVATSARRRCARRASRRPRRSTRVIVWAASCCATCSPRTGSFGTPTPRWRFRCRRKPWQPNNATMRRRASTVAASRRPRCSRSTRRWRRATKTC
jgi:hypothetical protein